MLIPSIQIFDYVRDKEDFVTLFLNHLGTSAIMDLLLQMVAVPSNDQCRVDMAQVKYTCTCLGSEKSWVRIPPEAAHFSLKKGRWVVSDIVVLLVICIV